MYQASYFIGRDFYLVQHPVEWVHAERQRPWSALWYCSICGEVWARRVIPDSPFTSFRVSCEKHRDHSLEVPGSVFSQLPDAGIPKELLRRELLLHIANYEKVST